MKLTPYVTYPVCNLPHMKLTPYVTYPVCNLPLPPNATYPESLTKRFLNRAINLQQHIY